MSAAAFCAIVVGLAGCGEDPPPPQAPVVQAEPPPPPPPPAPKVTPVADLMAELGIDKRINLPEDKAPDNDPARIALLEFFDAFVRGDDSRAGNHRALRVADESDQRGRRHLCDG